MARLQREYRDRQLQRRQLNDAQAEIASLKRKLTEATWDKVRHICLSSWDITIAASLAARSRSSHAPTP